MTRKPARRSAIFISAQLIFLVMTIRSLRTKAQFMVLNPKHHGPCCLILIASRATEVFVTQTHIPQVLRQPKRNCVPVEIDGEYVCSECNASKDKGRTKPFRRNCASPVVRLAPELERLIASHRTDCVGAKVSHDTLRQRATECDTCNAGDDTDCGLARMPFRVLLPMCSHQCPGGKWPALPRRTRKKIKENS